MIDKTKNKYWEFSINVEVNDITDFDWKKLYDELVNCADRNLKDTCWQYTTQAIPHYPTEYRTIYCDSCNTSTSQISIDGNDFICLICEDKKRREYS